MHEDALRRAMTVKYATIQNELTPADNDAMATVNELLNDDVVAAYNLLTSLEIAVKVGLPRIDDRDDVPDYLRLCAHGVDVKSELRDLLDALNDRTLRDRDRTLLAYANGLAAIEMPLQTRCAYVVAHALTLAAGRTMSVNEAALAAILTATAETATARRPTIGGKVAEYVKSAYQLAFAAWLTNRVLDRLDGDD